MPRKAAPRLPLVFEKHGFTKGNWESAERRFQVPGGYVDITINQDGVKKIKDADDLMKAVAVLSFVGGQKARQKEIEAIQNRAVSAEADKATYKGRLDSIERIVVG